jgi:acyl-CoA synthetase (AMP-forming)/AMP-acid ligase II
VDVDGVGVPDDKMGEQLKAIVERRRGAVRTAGEIIAFRREEMAHCRCPRSVDLVKPPRDRQKRV